MPLTPSQKDEIVADARRGLGWETCANRRGIDRVTLWRERKADPDLDSRMASALASWDAEMAEKEADAISAGDFNGAAVLQKMRANRLPQRYSPDPKMRDYRPRKYASESRVEDAEEEGEAPTGGVDLGDAITALIDAKRAGKL